MLALATKRHSCRVTAVRREVIGLSFFSSKSELLQDNRETIGTEGKEESGVEMYCTDAAP